MKAIRASIISFFNDPGDGSDASTYVYFADGCVVVNALGCIEYVGPWDAIKRTLGPAVQIDDYSGYLLSPGFIDSHVHGSQLDVIASYGTQLLEWLARHTFPAEQRLADPVRAAAMAELFFLQLIRNGTTSAAVWPTVHEQATDEFFQQAQTQNMRVICGKVLMDQHCPTELRDSSVAQTERVLRSQIERWHGQDRLSYAMTPRFAVATSEALMLMAGRLFSEIPGLYMQNHLAENHAEIDAVAKMYPQDRSYLSLYERMGFCGPRSIFAHCLWLDKTDWSLLARTNSRIAFCPSSNLFLGSGFFQLDQATDMGITVGLATDVGGGSSLSMLNAMASAYIVQQNVVQQNAAQQNAVQKPINASSSSLHPLRQFYLATLGGARCLDWEGKVGQLAVGCEADMVVLRWSNDPLSRNRQDQSHQLSDRLFALSTLGDQRNIKATYVKGELRYFDKS